LSELLEVRHRFIILGKFIPKLQTEIGLGAHSALFKAQIISLIDTNADLAKRFDANIGALAEQDPIIGFKMRSKGMVVIVLDMLDQMRCLRHLTN
jgi:hypothetical protein